MEVHDFDTYCRDCEARVGVKGQQSGRATAALICGVLPLMTFCLPLAIPAVILGHMELSAIERGEAPASGRNLAKGGVILGWINIGLMVLGIVIGIAIALS